MFNPTKVEEFKEDIRKSKADIRKDNMTIFHF